ncbi:hypothetical protein J1614_011122 [Plenodomus biglobosus]|nr:hypothetical protein J1614_011122 [Plenodomus biglobosus]
MVLRIRLARFGKKHAPFYNIVVAHARYASPSYFSNSPTTSPSALSNKPNCNRTRNHSAFSPPPSHSPTLLTPNTNPPKPTPHTNTPPSTARNSRPLEVLGTYDPKPQPPRPGDTHGRPWKDIKLDISRARYWVGVGAQPSDTAWRLLSMVGILEPQYRVGKIQGQVVRADSAAKSLIGG